MFLFIYIYLLIIYVEYPQIFRGVPHFERGTCAAKLISKKTCCRAWPLGIKHGNHLIICDNPALYSGYPKWIKMLLLLTAESSF